LVYIPEDLQLQRLMSRDLIDETTAKKKMDSQLSIEVKKSLADIVIDNSDSKEKTYMQIDKYLASTGLC